MDVLSRYIEHDDLGQLHVVRFQPEADKSGDHGIVFNSFNGRVTTLDGFVLPYLFAEETGMTTDYIERPSTGSSSEITDKRVRRDYQKFGFIAVRDGIAEALFTDDSVYNAERLHVSGFSLGGHSAAVFTGAIYDRLRSVTLIDAPGFCKVNRVVGTMRYAGYSVLEAAASFVQLKSDTHDMYGEFQQAYEAFRDATDLPEPPDRSLRDKKTELHEVTQPTQGEALVTIEKVMRTAVQDEHPLTLRASFSPMRFMTDHRSISQTNRMLDLLDASFPRQQSVEYGFLQKNGMSFWHSMALKTDVIREMLTMPITSMRKRLKLFR